MRTVRVDLGYCYGISSLTYEFDFQSKRQYAVYAPNGVMKSSLALAFKDLSEGELSRDRVFPQRETVRDIVDEDGHSLSPESVFVVEPYSETYRSNRMSTLLVNERLREQYDQVRRNIDEKKDQLVRTLSSSCGLKKGIDERLAADIVSDSSEFFTAIGRVRQEATQDPFPYLKEIKYSEVFTDKVEEQLASAEFRDSLSAYMDVYDQLTGQSTFFRRGVFNHNNAADVAKSLKANGFFKAQHSVYVNNRDRREEIKTEEDLERVIQEEKDAILENPELKIVFEKIDKVLTKNVEMKAFRKYISDHPELIPELSNPQRLKQRLWITYLGQNVALLNEALDCYEQGRERLEGIVESAKNEATRWRAVLDEFNERFSVPFVVTMENQHDVILRADAPAIRFRFRTPEGEAAVEEGDLLRVLSNGEKRALYLLNIIFEVIARRDSSMETLFVLDDIADSFDYKNKYAIVEYLRDITEVPHFYALILTHNFDFYRTVAGRLGIPREHRLHAVKKENGVSLKQEKYQKNPFDTWRREIPAGENSDYLIAAIPFLRNIAEYTCRSDLEAGLTSYLHIKPESVSATVGDLKAKLQELIEYSEPFDLPGEDRLLLDLIFERAEAACGLNEEQIELESKIVLALAIRLRAEQFMIGAINDQEAVDGITKNQTSRLVTMFEERFPGEAPTLRVLKQVNLMTPENIHLNSFMYEPILDMANLHLKNLYARVVALQAPMAEAA